MDGTRVSGRLVAPDLPGCGRSPKPTRSESYRIDAVARQLRQVVEAAGLERFHLVGHSLGAAVAIQLLEDLGEQVLDLCLFGPAPLDGVKGMQEGGGAMAELLRSFPPNDRAKMGLLRLGLESGRLLGTHRLRLEEAIRAQMAPHVAKTHPDLVRGFSEIAAQQSTDAILGYLHALFEVDHVRRAADMRLPVSVVWGELDAIVPRTAVERLATTFPNAELSVWAEVGHAPMVEVPRKTAQHLERFWRRTEGEAAPTILVTMPMTAVQLGPWDRLKLMCTRAWRRFGRWVRRARGRAQS